MEDVVFMSCMIPLLMMLAVPNGKEVSAAYLWLDAVPIAALVFLSFIVLFGVFPWIDTPFHPVNELTLNAIFLLCMFYVALFLVPMLFISPKGENKNIAVIVSIVMTANIAVYTLNNFLLIQDGKIIISSPWLISQTFPMTFLSLASLLWPLGSRSPQNVPCAYSSGVVFSISPWLLWLGPLLLGIWAIRTFPGTASIAVILLACSYALRMALEQSRKTKKLLHLLQRQNSYEKHISIDIETSLPNLNGLVARLEDRKRADPLSDEALAIITCKPHNINSNNNLESVQISMRAVYVADSILRASAPYDAWVARISEWDFALIFKFDIQRTLNAVAQDLAAAIEVESNMIQEQFRTYAGVSLLDPREDARTAILRARRGLAASLASKAGTVTIELHGSLIRVK